MTKAEAVAADTSLIRRPTPRRYLAALEDLRGRRIAILPMVDRELKRQLLEQAADYVCGLCRKDGIQDAIAAVKAAGRAAAEWWAEERGRNDSTYMHMPDLGDLHYYDASMELPGDAFTDRNGSDRFI